MQALLHSEVAHFVIYIAVAALIGGMPAPTANSTIAYQWAFRSLNLFAANFVRATSTKIEKSPNFQDAVNIQQIQAGQTPTLVKTEDHKTEGV